MYLERTEEFNKLKTEDLLVYFEKIVEYYSSEANILINSNYKTSNLTQFQLEKLNGLSTVLSLNYKAYFDSIFEEKFKFYEKGLLIQSWVSLGAILESIMQIFLKVYQYAYDLDPIIVKKGTVLHIL
ncbi:hypothetical protein [Rummeliibacillus stabekisii]|uniref:hypothetical protein n=1 Tax=Rummeliibacillus stabekisii TaxID=241244 RepID=UPI00371D3042